MHCPGDENVIPLYRPEYSDPESKVSSTLDIGQLEISTSQPDMASASKSKGASSDLGMTALRAENEHHLQFMKYLDDTADWLSDDE
jgi:hypothetical protein